MSGATVSVVESVSPAVQSTYDNIRRNRELLQERSSGAGVAQLQKDLNSWLAKQGRPAELTENGHYDARTVEVVKQFQHWARENVPGLKEATGVYRFEVDGILGPRTLRQLDLALGRPTLSEAEYHSALENAPRRSPRFSPMPSALLDKSLHEVLKSSCAEFGVSVELALAVMGVESGGDQNAVSAKGAIGKMQLMPTTAQELGVDPTNPRENIRGGVMYLSEMLQKFDGNLELALAGYNAGPGAVERFGRKVPPFAETRNYVARVMSSYSRLRMSGVESTFTTD